MFCTSTIVLYYYYYFIIFIMDCVTCWPLELGLYSGLVNGLPAIYFLIIIIIIISVLMYVILTAQRPITKAIHNNFTHKWHKHSQTTQQKINKALLTASIETSVS
jgi:hypothetical protein